MSEEEEKLCNNCANCKGTYTAAVDTKFVVCNIFPQYITVVKIPEMKNQWFMVRPLAKLMKKSAQITERLFEYTAGEDYKKRPPYLTFKDVEKNIKEEKLI